MCYIYDVFSLREPIRLKIEIILSSFRVKIENDTFRGNFYGDY